LTDIAKGTTKKMGVAIEYTGKVAAENTGNDAALPEDSAKAYIIYSS